MYNKIGYSVNMNLLLKIKYGKRVYSRKLLDQARDAIREKHYLIRTEQAYFEGTLSFKPVR